MADLTPVRDRESADRAQLVLVSAMVIAVILVTLVLLVNTAIYTENLATRDTDAGVGDAIAYRGTVVDGVGGIVDRENLAEYDSRTALEENVTTGVEALDVALVESKLDHGVSARVNESTLSLIDGQLIRQTDGSRNFTDSTGAANWTMAEDISGTRAFAATVDRASLVTANESTAGGAFQVVVADNDSSDTWRVYLYEKQSTGDLAVAVKNASESQPTEVCSVGASSATVGFTNGTLAGEDCPGLVWATGVDDGHDLNYANGDEAVGTYNVTVRTESGGTLGSLIDGVLSDDPDSPYHVPAVYAAEVQIAYDAPELVYAATVRVAPGEHDD